MPTVVMHALEHVAEHVVATVRGGAVGTEGDGDTGFDQLRHRAAAEDRHDGARVMHDPGLRLPAQGDVFLGEVDAVGHEGRRTEQTQFVMGQRQRTRAVAVLGERQAMSLGQLAVLLRLLTVQRGQLSVTGFVLRRVHRQGECNAHAAVGHAVTGPGDVIADLEHLLETDAAPSRWFS